MEDWEKIVERPCAAAAIRHLWQMHQVTYRPIVMAVFGMAVAPGATYWDILEAVAQYMGVGSAREWHTDICYHLLKAGAEVEGSAEEWLRSRAEEVRRIADGICA